MNMQCTGEPGKEKQVSKRGRKAYFVLEEQVTRGWG